MIALLVLIGIALLVIAFQLRRGSAPPVAGKLVYTDTDRQTVSAPINSHKSRLTCKPDFLYRLNTLAARHRLRFNDILIWHPKNQL